MQSDAIKDQLRRWIVEQSIGILRGHGKSKGEIRSMLLKDFRIGEAALNELLKKNADWD